jgi:FlaA1/EpsC-like NDP-sugar epimerase
MAEASDPALRGADERRVWWSFLYRRPFHFLLDALVLTAALGLAYALRFEFRVPQAYLGRALWQAPAFVALQLVCLGASGVYSYIWRYVGMSELLGFGRGIALSVVPVVVLRVFNVHPLDAPVSVIVMDTFFAFTGVVGLRVLRRSVYETFEKRGQTRVRRPVLLIGAGRAGVLAAREILSRREGDLDVKGFVDDDEQKVGSVIGGVKVLGATRDLPRLCRDLAVDHVIITIASATRDEMRRILDVCAAASVKARVIPGLWELLQGNVSVSRIRNVEIEDLLGREPVQLDMELVGRFLTERVVVVTGAGGSIGSELCRQIARFGPQKLLLLEQAEGALFEIERDLLAKFPGVTVVPLIADVTDAPRIDRIFAQHRPHVVLHAAAHKHVPMMEKNPGEAVKNNVLGSRVVGEAAGRYAAQAFVQISTDKAVRPSSIMGATKRVAELVLQRLDRRFSETRFVAVRFGNVLGSAGSVIPIFRQQILAGGPVTVTHPDMVRYFMTIPEAAQLVLQAGAMGEGGEIFVLDMGEPVKIVDLARDMIRLSGLRPGDDIEISFTGMRPGEKLFEELNASGEDVSTTKHPKILIGRIQGVDDGALDAALVVLEAAAVRADADAVRASLRELLPESMLGAPVPNVTAPPSPSTTTATTLTAQTA